MTRIRRRSPPPHRRNTGPLSPRAPRTVDYAVDGPAHELLAHPFPRRVRAEFAGRTVLDTTAGVLLHETALLPRLYVPEADLDASAFAPSTTTTHCPFEGDATYRSLRVGDREVPDALWAHPDPVPSAPGLAGYASLHRDAADPCTRVDVRPTSRRVRVYAGDLLVAESHHPLRLDETGLPVRWYLDPADVRVPLEPTATRTRCPSRPGSPGGSASCTTTCAPSSTTAERDEDRARRDRTTRRRPAAPPAPASPRRRCGAGRRRAGPGGGRRARSAACGPRPAGSPPAPRR